MYKANFIADHSDQHDVIAEIVFLDNFGLVFEVLVDDFLDFIDEFIVTEKETDIFTVPVALVADLNSCDVVFDSLLDFG